METAYQKAIKALKVAEIAWKCNNLRSIDYGASDCLRDCIEAGIEKEYWEGTDFDILFKELRQEVLKSL
jgi:hypothetical protein